MPEQFPLIEVPLNAYELSENEPIGTKYKFWFHDATLGRCIYKQATENTGEDWAEKIASELCKFLELPHAKYELAIFNERRGIFLLLLYRKTEASLLAMLFLLEAYQTIQQNNITAYLNIQ